MRPATRIWLAAMVVGWGLLITGWITGSTWAIGAAVLIFLVFAVERWDNWRRSA